MATQVTDLYVVTSTTLMERRRVDQLCCSSMAVDGALEIRSSSVDMGYCSDDRGTYVLLVNIA
jgi:hypothetical protein